MPLLVSLHGLPTPYAPEPVSPVEPAFESVLSRQLGQTDGGRAGLDSPGAKPTPPKNPKLGSYGKLSTDRPRKPALLASQIMTQPVTVLEGDQPVGAAHDLMERNRFRHLPVVSIDRKLIGILSDRDVLRAPKDDAKPATQLMSARVLTATPETPIQQIAEAMLENRIGALPIVDDDHRVVGIVTTTDLLKAIVRRAPLELWA